MGSAHTPTAVKSPFGRGSRWTRPAGRIGSSSGYKPRSCALNDTLSDELDHSASDASDDDEAGSLTAQFEDNDALDDDSDEIEEAMDDIWESEAENPVRLNG